MKKNFLLVSGLITLMMVSCLKDESVKPEYNGFQPLVIQDDWQVSTPEAENMNRKYLDLAYRLFYNDERFVMADMELLGNWPCGNHGLLSKSIEAPRKTEKYMHAHKPMDRLDSVT